MLKVIDRSVLELNDDDLETYIFEYLEQNNNIIGDRDILVCLDYLGYKWTWNEYSKTVSNIRKGKNKNVFVVDIEDTINDTMDIQTDITHSYEVNSIISHNTINLPADISKDEVAKVYIDAYKKGVIGVTVYRDGSRDGVLVHKSQTEPEKADRAAPKRPNEIDADVNILTVNKTQYFCVIGLIDGKPYEVFTGENYTSSGEVFIPKNIKTGTIKKYKKGKYVLVNEGIEYDISKGHTLEEAEALTRQISLNLRHGTPIQFIVEQLLKNDTFINFSKAVARTLKHYIPQGVGSTAVCECGGKMIYTDGCVSCPQCGKSKCS